MALNPMRLEARALAFGYPGHPVGRDVSMSVSTGEVVCLLGPNGGGKTTLFKTLLGLLHPQGGAVMLDGADITGHPARHLARTVSYVPQAHEGYFPFTVRDVVLMGRTAHVGLFAMPSRYDRERAAAVLAEAGIAHLADAIYTRISGGERQLTLIARALAQDARLMVFDEPTASLDFGNQVRVLDRVLVLAQQGIGVLLSTHNPDHALACADRVLLLHGGRILDEGAPGAVITAENLKKLYGVEVDIAVVGPDATRRMLCIPRVGRSTGPCTRT
jgi:iron complex transport system ATP-binding protein